MHKFFILISILMLIAWFLPDAYRAQFAFEGRLILNLMFVGKFGPVSASSLNSITPNFINRIVDPITGKRAYPPTNYSPHLWKIF